MGGADAVLARARADFEKGEYRWVAQVVNDVVFADPDNAAARELQADTLEQLGYQAENGTWRNFYLSAAKELRDGVVQSLCRSEQRLGPIRPRRCRSSMFLQYLAVRLNGPKAADRRLRLRPVVHRPRRAVPPRGRATASSTPPRTRRRPPHRRR